MRGLELVLLSAKPRSFTPPPELSCSVDVILERNFPGALCQVKTVQVCFHAKGQHAYGFRISQEQAAALARALSKAAKA